MEAMFDHWSAVAFDKQMAMMERFGSGAWTGDRVRGMIRCGDWEQPAQFLGCESDCGDRWTWGWAYAPGSVPGWSLDAARRMRAAGRNNELMWLLAANYPLEGRCGHLLAMSASGCLGAEFYVECETEEGSLYFLSTERSAPVPVDPLDRVFRVFPRLVGHPDCAVKDQRHAFESYLEYYGFKVEYWPEKAGELVCGRLPRSRRLILGGFDAENRATSLAEAHRTRRKRD